MLFITKLLKLYFRPALMLSTLRIAVQVLQDVRCIKRKSHFEREMVDNSTYLKAIRLDADKLPRTYLDSLLNKPGPASDPDWVPGPETISALESSKVLSVRI